MSFNICSQDTLIPNFYLLTVAVELEWELSYLSIHRKRLA